MMLEWFSSAVSVGFCRRDELLQGTTTFSIGIRQAPCTPRTTLVQESSTCRLLLRTFSGSDSIAVGILLRNLNVNHDYLRNQERLRLQTSERRFYIICT